MDQEQQPLRPRIFVPDASQSASGAFGAESSVFGSVHDFIASPRRALNRVAARRRQSVTAGTIRHDVFEKLWSAHASTTAWSRSFLPATSAGLSKTESDALDAAYREVYGGTGIPVNAGGIRAVRSLLNEALGVLWCASDDETLRLMQVAVDGCARHANSDHTRLDLEGVRLVANAMKAEVMSRPHVSVADGVGHAAAVQEDPYANTDEIASAYVALGGPSDLAGDATRSAACDALHSAGVRDTVFATDYASIRGRRNSDVSLESGYTARKSVRSATSRVTATSGTSGGTGSGDRESDDEDDDRLPFADFHRAVAIDKWKATTARLFVTLGGDPSDPTSTASLGRIMACVRRMLQHEMCDAAVDAYTARLQRRFGDATGVTFEQFDLNIIAPLRRIVGGGLGRDGSNAAAAGSPGGGGSAGLLKMLTYVPTGAKRALTTQAIMERLEEMIDAAKTSRGEYMRIRGKTSQLFATTCTFRETPLFHLVKLTRRRLLYVVNMVTQRRLFNLSPPNRTIETFLRALTAAAKHLAEHTAACKHCTELNAALHPKRSAVNPMAASQSQQRPPAPGTAGKQPLAPRPPASRGPSATPGNDDLRRTGSDSQRPLSPARAPSGVETSTVSSTAPAPLDEHDAHEAGNDSIKTSSSRDASYTTTDSATTTTTASSARRRSKPARTPRQFRDLVTEGPTQILPPTLPLPPRRGATGGSLTARPYAAHESARVDSDFVRSLHKRAELARVADAKQRSDAANVKH